MRLPPFGKRFWALRQHSGSKKAPVTRVSLGDSR
ncbi:hypothetical protein BSNT_09687 [Bacillus subtilis subsp. natto BEST195]|nr:hypothetical protein BSNT_09687 [Bacillus subtilis subsp. natto BEST195]